MRQEDPTLAYWLLGQCAENDWLIPSAKHSLVFRRPSSFRGIAAIWSVFILISGFVLLRGAVQYPSAVFGPSLFGSIELTACLFVLLSLGCYLCFHAGTSIFSVDLSLRTYRFQCGLPFLTWRYEGRLEDIQGLYVEHSVRKLGPVNRLFLTWRNRGRPPVMLGVFLGDLTPVEAYLGQLSRLLDAPHLPTYRAYEHSVVWKVFGPNHWLTGGK